MSDTPEPFFTSRRLVEYIAATYGIPVPVSRLHKGTMAGRAPQPTAKYGQSVHARPGGPVRHQPDREDRRLRERPPPAGAAFVRSGLARVAQRQRLDAASLKVRLLPVPPQGFISAGALHVAHRTPARKRLDEGLRHEHSC